MTESEAGVRLEGDRAGSEECVPVLKEAETNERAPVAGPQTVRFTGWLQAIDYRHHTAKVWDQLGHLMRVRFDDSQGVEVDAARQQFVTVEGVRDTVTSADVAFICLTSITIRQFDTGFWRPKTLAQMIKDQGIRPIAHPAELAFSWDDDDGEDFLAARERWHQER